MQVGNYRSPKVETCGTHIRFLERKLSEPNVEKVVLIVKQARSKYMNYSIIQSELVSGLLRQYLREQTANRNIPHLHLGWTLVLRVV